jgi:DNA replication protein DnaC
MTAHDLAHDPGRRTGRADWTAACVYLAPKVLIVDVGYVLLDELGTSVVFQLISARYERGSVILASDKSYRDWGSIFGETRLSDTRQTSG